MLKDKIKMTGQEISILDNENKLGENNIIKEFLRKGGLRCQILKSGTIKIGDEIKII